MAYRLAALCLGIIVGLYWLRVVRMARKFRKQTGRAANFLPPERIGRLLRIVWLPVVLIWIAHPWLTALLSPMARVLRPVWQSPWFAWPAVAVAAVAWLATRACWRIMGRNWRMGIDPSERTSLVVAGPYAYVRHPIYALSQAMMLASVAAIPSPLLIAAGLAHVLLLHWEARREEDHLLQSHGPEYAQYCAGIGRFIPRAAFSLPRRGQAERWRG